MSYNWEKIFKDKNLEELYKIFIGENLLDSEAKKIAKQELIRRKFDFNNVGDELNKDKIETENDLKIAENLRKRFKVKPNSTFTSRIAVGFLIIFPVVAKEGFIIEKIIEKPLVYWEWCLMIIVGITYLSIGVIGFIVNLNHCRKMNKITKINNS